MQRRDRFVAELREAAESRGLEFRISKRKGNGSHAMVYVVSNKTTLPDREIDPKTASKIRKGLGLG